MALARAHARKAERVLFRSRLNVRSPWSLRPTRAKETVAPKVDALSTRLWGIIIYIGDSISVYPTDSGVLYPGSLVQVNFCVFAVRERRDASVSSVTVDDEESKNQSKTLFRSRLHFETRVVLRLRR